MPTTIACSFGDIVLVPFPFTDQSAIKRRPAIVVSSSLYHKERPDVILIAVTSQMRPVSASCEAAITSWREAGLLRPSVIKPLLATVDAALVIRRLGALTPDDLASLRGVLRAILAA